MVNFLIRQEYLLEKRDVNYLKTHKLLASAVVKPDILVGQFGFAACNEPYNNTKHTEAMISKAERNIPPLLNSFVISTSQYSNVSTYSGKTNSRNIVSLASRSIFSDHRSEVCTWKLNRMLAYEAHAHNVVVLEREEIEHRLLFRSEQTENPLVRSSYLLETPAPQIVTASLLSILTCIENNSTFVLK